MNLNESIVEDAALILPAATLTRPLPTGEEQSRFARTLIPAFSQREKEKRDAIRRLNGAIPEEARGTIKHYLQVRLERSQKP